MARRRSVYTLHTICRQIHRILKCFYLVPAHLLPQLWPVLDMPPQVVSKKIQESQRVKHVDYDNYDGHRHVVKVVENTPLHDWFRDSLEEDKMEILVNSYHHQGVNRLAQRFVPMAFAPDGLIEGFYDPDTCNPEEGKFIMGLQFHPERMRKDDTDKFDYPGCPRAYQEFVKAVIAYQKKLNSSTTYTMAAPTDLVEQNQQGTEAILEDLTTRMTQALRQSLNQTPAVTYDTAAPIAIKLNGTNYALWSQIVEMYISGKDKLGYINGDLPKPELNDPTFRRWRTENSIVKGWLINSMDPSLVSNFIRFPTAKQVWESIATTYFDGNDKSQRHNTLLQEDRVYVFLDGLDDRLDKIRSDVLQLQPFPSVEQAYAYVRREDIRQSVMLETNGGPTASVMATKSGKQNQMLRMTKRAPGYAATGGSKNLSGGLGCSHCGNAKHTRETCFKLHGYPEWWNEFKAKKSQEANGGVGRAAIAHGGVERTAIAHAEPTLSLIPCVETKAETASNGSDQGKGCCYTSSALVVSTKQKDDDWIVDSGATDHMTYNPDDLDEYITPRRNNISNANGVLYPVTGAGTVQLSPSISLTNTLLVPSLTTKLISVGQATEDLNCIVLMYPHFCLFQDILTKKIIGRGNEEMGILPIHADEERDIRAVINVEREDDDDATGTPSEDMETKRAATVEEEMGVSVDMGEEDLIADLAEPRTFYNYQISFFTYTTSVPRPLKLDQAMEKKRKNIIRSFFLARNIYTTGQRMNPSKESELQAGAEFLEAFDLVSLMIILSMQSSTALSLQQENRLKQMGATVRNAGSYIERLRMNEEREDLAKNVMGKMSAEQLSDLLSFYHMMGHIFSEVLDRKLNGIVHGIGS
ncbi:hypothetical protein POTOM_055293 [Populus tomentosa]|uniref:Uncharacterized protein n=1 Tax=Populus tomentosa TaxID=118781 RepID=A0A8X8BZ24_POPTO|nr:hypothetical protein POTOM_055293 [Populus tomentosa]